MLANALANECGVPFIPISAPSVVSGMSGESEKKLREIFEEAKNLAPSLVFIDEIDAITPKRDGAQREMERRIVAQLLTCMDDVSLEKTGGRPVIIIGATNRPDAIDPALRRAGRFDREICMSVPSEASREHILRKISESRNLKLEPGFDYTKLAKLTPGYVGADLHGLVTAAGETSIRRVTKELVENQPISQKIEEQNGHERLLQEIPENGIAQLKGDNMEIDEVRSSDEPIAPSANPSSFSTIEQFLSLYPNALSDEQMAPFDLSFEDFMTALPTVQPSSKREGFATVPDVTWDDVGAMSHIRQQLELAIVNRIKFPKLFSSAGISASSGVLLWGPPGCGKTLIAKAVANESKASFISVKGPELLNKYVGESERAVRLVFERARQSVPCVIFFDELDALVPHRDDSKSESSSRVVNTLLTELDGVGGRQGIYVIAATNRPDMIDSAMLRFGRLSKKLYVDLPSAKDREEILRALSRGLRLGPEVDLALVAADERCENFTGADLSALKEEAALIAIMKHVEMNDENMETTVTAEDFEKALSKIKPSVTAKDRRKYEKMEQSLGSYSE